LGLVARELARDVKLGIIGFLMLAPPVYVIQGLLVYFWQPSKHPLMEMFKASPDPGFYALLFVAAAVVAPIFEEMVFRVILQGFLEKAFSLLRDLIIASRTKYGRQGLLGTIGGVIQAVLDQTSGFPYRVLELIVGFPSSANKRLSEFPTVESLETKESVLRDGDHGHLNPYVPSALIVGEQAAATPVADPAVQPELLGASAWLPIALSAIIFALLHFSHGPDWVALTLLAAGMGYLYQRTHRLVPSLVVHALLNSLSMWGLWLQVYLLPEQGLGQ
jgi:membrane protease YdiL (CAAX protease family)